MIAPRTPLVEALAGPPAVLALIVYMIPALVPGAALIFYPVTAIAGPLFAYNLAMLLCPVLAAFFTFLLCRRLTGQFWPALFGG